MEPVPAGEGLTLFKYEGFVIHVEARTLETARGLLTAALECGYKNSGMVIGKRFMVGIRGTLKIDAPVAENGQWMITEEYLQLLGRMANDKFADNEARLEKFQKAVHVLVSLPSQPASIPGTIKKGPTPSCFLTTGLEAGRGENLWRAGRHRLRQEGKTPPEIERRRREGSLLLLLLIKHGSG